MTAIPEFSEPEVAEGIGEFRYIWKPHGITVKLSRLDNEAVGEICVYHQNGDNKARVLSISKLNLLAKRSCAELAKELKQTLPVDWNTMLTYIAFQTIQRLRRGEPVVEIGEKPADMKREYLLHPILPKNQPTTLYAPGGIGKSVLALYIACLVQNGMASPLAWYAAEPGNVLYLDWEDDKETHERRLWAVKGGLEAIKDIKIRYRKCSRPLIEQIDEVAALVTDLKIDLVIVDSAMAAMAESSRFADPADGASRYYNSLRLLGCTSLTIDHVAKHRLDTGDSATTGPYGSVVKTKRARNQFELEVDREPGESTIYLKMTHRKVNEGMLLPSLGIQVAFSNDDEGNAGKITFESFDLRTSAKFAPQLGLRELAINVLSRKPLQAAALAKEMGMPKAKYQSVYALLNKWQDKRGGFRKLTDETWTLYED